MGATVSTTNIKRGISLAERNLREIPRERDCAVVSWYMPPTFPLEINISPAQLDICRKTWKSIVTGRAQGMQSLHGRSGIVLFYDEFYFRLFQRAAVFKIIFPNMQKRGEVLTKAMVSET
ncbi:unnamed protein product [Phaeothamnion confervicola]